MRTSVTWEGKFDAAHHLPGHDKCGVVHGHTYSVSIRVEGEVQENGMIVDFHDVKALVKQLDHKDLNEILTASIPTAENLSRFLAMNALSLGEHIHRVRVRLYEGGNSYAETEIGRSL